MDEQEQLDQIIKERESKRKEIKVQLQGIEAERKALREAEKEDEEEKRKRLDDFIDQNYKGDPEAWAKDLAESINKPEKEPKKKGKSKKKKNDKGVGEEEKGVITGVELKSKVASPPELGLGFYEGTKRSFHSTTALHFIEASPSQITKIDDLIEISCNSPYIVSVTDLVDNSMLIVDKGLKDVRSHFQEPADFHSDSSHSEWWKHISKEFTSIFRDLIHGMIYLSSLDERGCEFFVSAKGEGKLLPSMDKEVTEKHALSNLIDLMLEVLTLPFPESEIDDSYDLPPDLKFIFQFVTDDKLDSIPFYWLLNQPFFWSSEEKTAILKDTNNLIKQDVLCAKNIDTHVEQKNPGSDWSLQIDVSVCQNLFQEMFCRSPSLKSKLNFKKYDGKSFCELVRYCTSCYNHCNDNFHRLSRTRANTFLSQNDIEAVLGGFFPTIYTDLYDALYISAKDAHVSSLNQIPMSNDFQRWSRPYLARKETRD